MKQIIFDLFPQWFKELPHADKFAHVFLALVIFFGLNLFIQMIFACAITIIVAFVNEFVDKNKKGNHFDWWDIFFTVAIPVIVTVFNLI